MDSLEQIKDTAAQWVAKRHGTEWTQADEAALNRWLDASIGNRVEYLGHEQTWRAANRLKVLGAGSKPGVVQTVDSWRSSPYFKHLRKVSPPSAQPAFSAAREERSGPSKAGIFGLAAGVLVVCAASYFGWDHLRGDRYSTSTGVTTAVPLPDGSKITLNTASEIRVAVTQAERRIDLDQGEAFFDVAKDPLRPFTVIAGDRRIVAVGTKFSVRRDVNDIHVIVTEGKVRLGSALSRAGATGGQEEVLLSAGSIAKIHAEKVTVQQRSLPRTEELLSWREGYLMFDEVSLAEAVAEFNRYNTQKFLIKDAAIADIPVTGHFRSTSIEPFARLLEQGFPVSVTREKDTIVLGSP